MLAVLMLLGGLLVGMFVGAVVYMIATPHLQDPTGGGMWSVDPMHPDAYVPSDDAYRSTGRPADGWFGA